MPRGYGLFFSACQRAQNRYESNSMHYLRPTFLFFRIKCSDIQEFCHSVETAFVETLVCRIELKIGIKRPSMHYPAANVFSKFGEIR